MLDRYIQKTQLSCDLDIDFGQLFPTSIEGYLITIKSLDLGRFKFLLILPEIESDARFEKIVDNIMHMFFSTGDKYWLRRVTEDEIDEYQKNKYLTPILSFDQRTVSLKQISFFWLVPPLSLRQ